MTAEKRDLNDGLPVERPHANGNSVPVRRILVVDDDRDFASGLSDLLDAEGYEVRTAHGIAEALGVIRDFDAKVAILDFQLGQGTGLDLVAPLEEARPGINFLLATAHADVDMAIRSLRSGIYDFFRKPVQIGELLAALRRCFELIRLKAERREAEARLRESETLLQARVVELEEAQRRLERQGEDLVRIAGDLVVARNQAEAASQSKTRFLATMSHELRTPLNAIIGFSEILIGADQGSAQNLAKYREYADFIHDSGHHLLVLISDILDLSKIEAGTEDIREQEVDVSYVVGTAIRTVEQRARQAGVELGFDLAEDLPLLTAEERKLKQILINLLDNAVKFTDPGGKVALKVWCDQASGYAFQVSDTGVGMAAADIPDAMSPFGQLHKKDEFVRSREGAGLGLPLAKCLTELHGGSLGIQSEPGVGTTVTVRLPAARIVRTP